MVRQVFLEAYMSINDNPHPKYRTISFQLDMAYMMRYVRGYNYIYIYTYTLELGLWFAYKRPRTRGS